MTIDFFDVPYLKVKVMVKLNNGERPGTFGSQRVDYRQAQRMVSTHQRGDNIVRQTINQLLHQLERRVQIGVGEFDIAEVND